LTRRPRLAAAVASASALAVLLALLHAWRDLDYWNYSEGVYALTSRLLLAGDDLYGDVVVAQPPLMFLVGGAALALEDSILSLRLAVGGLQALTAALAAYAVWRLTGKGLAAAAAAALAMLTPWAVHEHGLLTPELVGAPLLVGGALLAARTGLAPAAGLVLSLAVFAKLPFALPALLVAVAAADRRRCLCWLAGAMLAQGAVWTATFGPAMWEAVVVAQQGTGLRTLKQVAEYGSQALWNLLGLLLPAIAAVFVLHRRASDADLLRTCAALAAGLLLTLPTMAKNGTGINVVAPIEAALVILAVTGATWAVTDEGRRRALQGATAVGFVLLLAQTASLFLAPENPRPFLRPDASAGLGPTLQTPEVEAEVRRARACPSGVPYSGEPYLAFVAERPIPANQPDGFLTAESSSLRDVLTEIRADQPRCP